MLAFSCVMHVCALNFAVLMLHEHAAPALTSMLSTSTARRCHMLALLQEQHNENEPLLHIFEEDATSLVSLLFYLSICIYILSVIDMRPQSVVVN